MTATLAYIMSFTTALVLLSAVSSTLALSPLLATYIPQPLSARAVNAPGGWALSQAGCPRDTSGCPLGGCCPNSLSCVGTGNGDGVISVCCPDTTQCVVPLLSAPFCADSSWSLWTAAVLEKLRNSESAYFCCLPGQVGLQTGDCVASDAVVAASLSASLVSPGSSTTIAALSTSSPIVSAVTGTSTSISVRTTSIPTSSYVSGTVTPTTSSGSSTSDGTGGNTTTAKSSLSTGAIIGVTVGAMVILFVALLALWRWHVTRKAKNNLETEAHAFNSANQGPLVGNSPMFSAPPTPYMNPVREYKTPAAGAHGYGGTPPPQHGLNGGPLPVEAPQAWQQRVEIGQGRE